MAKPAAPKKPATSAAPARPKAATATKNSATKAAAEKEADPGAVDVWLAQLPSEQRAALSTLRAQILAAHPAFIETIAWGVPQYYLGTSQVLGYSAAKKHVTFGPGHEAIDPLRDELAGFYVAKDTIRFTPDKPLPAALVKKLVKSCVAAHERKQGK